MWLYRPNATQVLSPADKDIIDKCGLAVVECSWARLSEIPFSKIASPHERLCAFLLTLILFPMNPACLCLHSAISRCDQPNKLRQALAAELCGGSCCCILPDWSRGLGGETAGTIRVGQLVLPR